jgi:predicted membrane channel-forming protein YqfA (hemolysin III family)
VKAFARIGFFLGLFFVIDAPVYLLTQHEHEGFTLIAMTAVGFAYLGLYAALSMRKAKRQVAREAAGVGAEEIEEPHIAPTIWPVVFALSAVGFTAGVLAAHWLLIVGGVLFVAAAVGWAADARRQWRHPEHQPSHGREP